MLVGTAVRAGAVGVVGGDLGVRETRVLSGLGLPRVLALRLRTFVIVLTGGPFTGAVGGLGVLKLGALLFCVRVLFRAGAGEAFQAGSGRVLRCLSWKVALLLAGCGVIGGAAAVLGGRFLAGVVLASSLAGLGSAGLGYGVRGVALTLVLARFLGPGLVGLLRVRTAVAVLDRPGLVVFALLGRRWAAVLALGRRRAVVLLLGFAGETKALQAGVLAVGLGGRRGGPFGRGRGRISGLGAFAWPARVVQAHARSLSMGEGEPADRKVHRACP